MTLADETLEEWVKAAAAAEPFELPTIDELGSGTLRRIVETLLVAEQALIWAGSRVSQFVWNIGYALDLMVWEEDMPMEAREAAVRLMPSLLERACASGDSGAVHMFWENVVERHELATRNDQYHRMRDAVFEALGRQLQMSGRCCQMSALHGLNHLWHPATPSLIERMRPLLADEETRLYADGAALFSHV